MLVRLDEKDGRLIPGRFLRAADLDGKLGEENNPEWKTVAFDETSGTLVSPNGTIGYRWGEKGEWNLEEKAAGADTKLQMTLILDDDHDDVRGVDFRGETGGSFLATLLSWLLPLGILIAFWAFAMRRMGSPSGVMAFAVSSGCFQ